jgi:hypothetical protein
MKRTGSHQSPTAPGSANPDAEKAALRTYAGDTFDDRVSEDIFDDEGECAEVDVIVHSLLRAPH